MTRRQNLSWPAVAMVTVLVAFVSGCAGSSYVKPSLAQQRSRVAPTVPERCSKAVRLRVASRIEVGRGVGALAVDGDTVWAARATAGTLTRVTKAGRATVHLGGAPVSVALGFGAAWVALRDAGSVVGIDRRTMAPVVRVGVPVPVTVRADSAGVWALSLDDAALLPLVTSSGAAGNEVDSPVTAPVSMVRLGDELWILGAGNGGLSPINTRLGRIIRLGVDLPGRSLAGLSGFGSTLWLAEPGRHDVLRVDTRSVAARELSAPDGMAPIATAAGPCGTWLASASGQLALVDSMTGRLRTPPLRLGRSVLALAGSGANVWASDPADGTLVHVMAEPPSG